MATSTDTLSRLVLRIFLLIGIVAILYYGRSVLLSLSVAGLLAMVLNPLDEKLRSWGMGRNLSIAGAMLVLVLFFAGLFIAVGQQANQFAENWPEIERRIAEQVNTLKGELGLKTKDLTAEEGTSGGGSLITTLGQQSTGEASTTGELVGAIPGGSSGVLSFVGSTLGVFGDFLLIMVYVVLLLSQKERLRGFAIRRAPPEKREEVGETIEESLDIVQHYLRGRLILIGILSVLYAIGFSVAGLDYAILIAVLAAILSIIPYLGNIIGGVIAVALAFAGGGGSQAIIGILITMSVAQMLESYILTPLIVGDEVEINSLTTVLCVVGMTILWGPVGAIIAIPLFAILRIIFLHVEGLEDYAFLLGQEE
ncbi:AI-2E family transporter [Lewinella sp. W8]|uniref:AI-2E family transporter n=1 Tax=Lewinella sp. W8 TaxID=2528208 RepID=UPI0010686E74|nr:AI-2E family transporter [Lewinella sp. W8]MTB53617.1 AI-2E family transporter [Lewinella sp. W8]